MFVPAYRGRQANAGEAAVAGVDGRRNPQRWYKEAVIYCVEVDASSVKKFAEFDLAPVGILDLWRLLSVFA